MLGIFRGPRPDVTPAMTGGFLLAGVPVIANLLHVFGVYDISAEQQDALNQAIQWGVIAAGALVLGDTGLRVGRNHADGKVQAAALTPALSPAQEDVAGLRDVGGVPGEDEFDERLHDDEFDVPPPPESAVVPDEPSEP